MSAKVEATIEIRDVLILKETLEKMKFSYKEVAGDIILERNWNPIRFQVKNDKVTYDSVHAAEVTNIKVQYAKNLKINELTALGANFEVHETEQMIEILVN